MENLDSIIIISLVILLIIQFVSIGVLIRYKKVIQPGLFHTSLIDLFRINKTIHKSWKLPKNCYAFVDSGVGIIKTNKKIKKADVIAIGNSESWHNWMVISLTLLENGPDNDICLYRVYCNYVNSSSKAESKTITLNV